MQYFFPACCGAVSLRAEGEGKTVEEGTEARFKKTRAEKNKKEKKTREMEFCFEPL